MITEDVQAQPRNSLFELLKNRNFILLWIAQIISQTAQQIINLALIVQVASITRSSTAVSGIIISFTIPAILFAAIAGVFVERNSKKTMLVLTNIARGVMVLAYVLTDERWGAGAVLPIFYVVTFLFAAVSQFFNPAELAMIPLVVQRKQLISANSLFNLSFTACQLIGFVILGPLLIGTVLHDNYTLLYGIISILFVVCAVLTYFLPQDSPQETAAARRARGEKVGVSQVALGASDIARSGWQAAREDLAEGWNFVRGDRVIFGSIMYWSVAITVFMMLGTIGPGFLQQVLGIDAKHLYYILMPGGLGLVVGVLLVSRFSTPTNRELMINVSLFLAGAVLLVFALVEPVTAWAFGLVDRKPPTTLMATLLGLMALILGLLNSFIAVPAQTALQERSPDDKRARVFSFFFTAQNVILIGPVFFAGALADSLGYPLTVGMIGVLVLIVAGRGVLLLKREGAAPEPSHLLHPTTEEVEAAMTAAVPPSQPHPANRPRQTPE